MLVRHRLIAFPAAALVVVGPLLSGTAGAAPAPATVPPLPLGAPGLEQTATEQTLAPGVTLTTVTRGHASATDSWVLRSFQPTQSAAEALAAQIRANGFAATVQRIDQHAPDAPASGPLGWLVVSPGYPSEDAAKQAAATLTAHGVTGLGVSNTALYEPDATGPWVVRILTVDHQHVSQVQAHLATDVIPEKETTSSVAQRLGAVAAVNGGYFVVGDTDGVPGDPAGIAIQNGVFDSEPVADRAALVLQRNKAEVESITASMTIRTHDGATTVLNGIDRSVGRIRDCGEPGDVPTQAPQQDVTCTNANEIVVFDRAFGPTAETGSGVAVTLDAQGRVTDVRSSRGGTIPPGGEVLEGIGAGANWLTAHAHVGDKLKVTERLQGDGHTLPVTPWTSAVNGGPFLVRDGRISIDAAHEGFVHPDDPGFYFAFGIARNPRTMAGVTATGDLLLVTVDGRAPGYSIGMSFIEEATVMRALGAVDALNLDGGGSTTMVAQGQLLGRPSDTTGERPVGDVLTVLPRVPGSAGRTPQPAR